MYSYLCDKMKSATMNKAVLMYQASRLIDPLHCNAKGDKDRKQRNVTWLAPFQLGYLQTNRDARDDYSKRAIIRADIVGALRAFPFLSWRDQLALHRVHLVLEARPFHATSTNSRGLEGLVESACYTASSLVWLGEEHLRHASQLRRGWKGLFSPAPSVWSSPALIAVRLSDCCCDAGVQPPQARDGRSRWTRFSVRQRRRARRLVFFCFFFVFF